MYKSVDVWVTLRHCRIIISLDLVSFSTSELVNLPPPPRRHLLFAFFVLVIATYIILVVVVLFVYIVISGEGATS
jgi:hypothetical protein